MKNNKNKSSYLRFSALALLCGAGIAAVGCNTNNNTDNLFFTVNGKDLEVTFCDRGASIYSIKYKDKFVTYHPKDKTTFLKDDYYYGKTLGRIAGRVKDGKIKVGSDYYQLEINETSGKKNNSLHGGKNSLTARDFKHYIEDKDDYVRVSFNYVSPALEAGYPELVDSLFSYKIYKYKSVIDLEISATSTGVTPVNLSTHPFFRLGDSGDILDHTLQINATEMAQYDDEAQDQTVIGTKTVINTPYNFVLPKKIGTDIEAAKKLDPVSGGYDHIWKFEGTTKADNYVELKNPDTNMSLKVTTDADAVILYANCYPHEKQEMNPSGVDTLYSGITIEPIKFFTRDNISSLNISPSNPFYRSTTYTFSNIK